MQPWEKEKSYKAPKNKKEKRSVRKKFGLAVHAVTISTIACSLIYGTLLYEFSKQAVFKIDPSLKK